MGGIFFLHSANETVNDISVFIGYYKWSKHYQKKTYFFANGCEFCVLRWLIILYNLLGWMLLFEDIWVCLIEIGVWNIVVYIAKFSMPIYDFNLIFRFMEISMYFEKKQHFIRFCKIRGEI